MDIHCKNKKQKIKQRTTRFYNIYENNMTLDN